jgi:hypothetical protein
MEQGILFYGIGLISLIALSVLANSTIGVQPGLPADLEFIREEAVVLGTIFGLILAIFGTFALGAYLTTSRAGRLGLVAMIISVLGSALFLPAVLQFKTMSIVE